MSCLVLPKIVRPRHALAALIAISCWRFCLGSRFFPRALGAIRELSPTPPAVLPGALVTITDTARGTVRTVTTNAAGGLRSAGLDHQHLLLDQSRDGRIPNRTSRGLVLDGSDPLHRLSAPGRRGHANGNCLQRRAVAQCHRRGHWRHAQQQDHQQFALEWRSFLNLLTLRPGSVDHFPVADSVLKARTALPERSATAAGRGLRHAERCNGQRLQHGQSGGRRHRSCPWTPSRHSA